MTVDAASRCATERLPRSGIDQRCFQGDCVPRMSHSPLWGWSRRSTVLSAFSLQTGTYMSEISSEKLLELDGFYAERSASGHANAWGLLVARLRELRRAIEAGEVVQIAGGPTLLSVLEFHTWAYGRYKLLEEGYDSWIGDDDS